MAEDPDRPHGKNLRRGRVSLTGQVYHITTVTLNRETVFSDLRNARFLINTLRQSQVRDEASTLAFVVMPDHLHWLMQLGERQSLSRVVRAVKVIAAHQIGKGIWQKGFHDHALRSDEDLIDVARYIVANPLRAGLVEHLGDYPHWDAVWL